MKILVWKIGALGDVVMTTPLIRQLRASHPDAQIDYLVGRSSAQILHRNPHLSNLIAFDESILVKRKLLRLRELIKSLRGYDIIFVLDKHWVFGLLAFLSRVPIRVGFSRTRLEGIFHTLKVSYCEIHHEIKYYLMLGNAFSKAVNQSDIALDLPAGTPFPLKQPYTVLINSGGNNFYERSVIRRMPNKLFSELTLYWSAQSRVIFVGSRDERSFYEPFASPTTSNLCGELTLQEVWSVLQNAERIFSTDSGLMHMAAAVNSQVTAVFGPTHPARKCPPGARWVWRDADIYDDCYELFGKIPEGEYFSSLSLQDIINDSHLASHMELP